MTILKDFVLTFTYFWVYKLESKSLSKRWKRQTLHLGQVELTLSLKYSAHPPDPPSSTAQQQPVFCVPIETVAQ